MRKFLTIAALLATIPVLSGCDSLASPDKLELSNFPVANETPPEAAVSPDAEKIARELELLEKPWKKNLQKKSKSQNRNASSTAEKSSVVD